MSQFIDLAEVVYEQTPPIQKHPEIVNNKRMINNVYLNTV